MTTPWHRWSKAQNLPNPPGIKQRDLIKAPMKRQERQISMPGQKKQPTLKLDALAEDSEDEPSLKTASHQPKAHKE